MGERQPNLIMPNSNPIWSYQLQQPNLIIPITATQFDHAKQQPNLIMPNSNPIWSYQLQQPNLIIPITATQSDHTNYSNPIWSYQTATQLIMPNSNPIWSYQTATQSDHANVSVDIVDALGVILTTSSECYSSAPSPPVTSGRDRYYVYNTLRGTHLEEHCL